MKSFAISSVLLLVCLSCQKPGSTAVEYVDANGESIPKIMLDLIEDETRVKFTDWFENIRLIELEKTENSLMRYLMRTYVGDEYIIISTADHGILMFSAEGDFVRVIAPHGRGPGEVMDANRNIFVDEKNHNLYTIDRKLHRDKALCIGIKTGEITYIPFQNTGDESGMRDIIVLNDSLMYVTTMQVMGRPSSCPLFCQTTSGSLLWEIDKTHPKGITNGQIRLVDGEIYFTYLFGGDTVFRLEEDKLKPVITSWSDHPSAYEKQEIGSVYTGVSPFTKNLFKGGIARITDLVLDEGSVRERPTVSDSEEFVFNQKTGKVQWIGSIKNDYLGFDGPFYLQILPNRKGIARYEAVDLYEKVDSMYHLPDLSKDLKSRMETILETLDVNDNHWLLVGDLKEDL